MAKNIIKVGKIFLSAIFVILFATSIQAENVDNHHGPKLSFATSGHDYGTIYFDKVNVETLEIEFTNTGDSPLLLNNVRACCGTVVTHWTHEPVLPGEKGTIDVSFRVSNRPHLINRVVTVDSNSIDNPRERFRITGRAQQSPDQSESGNNTD